jgi:hypothetical protein
MSQRTPRMNSIAPMVQTVKQIFDRTFHPRKGLFSAKQSLARAWPRYMNQLMKFAL